MTGVLSKVFRTWMAHRHGVHASITLNQRRIYILPTRQGLGFLVILLLMLLGDINYNLSLGYVLTFLLGTTAAMSMLHAFRNMTQLAIHSGRNNPVFAGETANFIFHFHNASLLARYQITLQDQTGHATTFDLPPCQTSNINLPLPADRRGWMECGYLTLYTEFPLGLFHAWSYLNFDAKCLVYPRPAKDFQVPENSASSGKTPSRQSGEDDFSGLRPYIPGDSISRIAWKTLARGQELQVKQFTATEGADLWLDWAQLPDTDEERKLQLLTRGVLDADASQRQYGLRLPEIQIPLANGDQHKEACLMALALHGQQQNVSVKDNTAGDQALRSPFPRLHRACAKLTAKFPRKTT